MDEQAQQIESDALMWAEHDGDLARASSPDDLRAAGWSVAVHNDYRVADEAFTFWLFTRGYLCVKGEGRTDSEALDRVREQICGRCGHLTNKTAGKCTKCGEKHP